MEHKYHIDGTEEFGYSIVNRFLYSFYLYMNTVKRITNLYRNASVLNLKGYVSHFCYLRFKSFDTLIKVVLEHKDYLASNCILRMLGDSVAVFHLIYLERDINISILRHCLYVIDGCERNLSVLSVDSIKEGTMPPAEIQNVKKQTEFNCSLRQRMMSQVQELLRHSPLKQKDKAAFDRIVKDRNWKFKEFKEYNKIGQNQYKWMELYKQIGYDDKCDILSFISQYTHGLSMSNLVMNMNIHNVNGVVGEAEGLIRRLHKDTLTFFADEQKYILEGLLEPEMRDKILACYDDEHRPTIAKWNQNVYNKISQLKNTGSFEICL